MLVLEIEYLGGVSFAAVGPDSPIPDWPPQPDRIFSALVATWAMRGHDQREARALEWLEAQSIHGLAESGAEPRTPVTVFVPPNDSRTDRQKHAKGVLPALRHRQPRRFPAARPNEPILRVLWASTPDAPTLAALERLARDTPYIGHSTSLTRCRFLVDADASALECGEARRSIYPGRFKELQAAYRRFEKSADRKDRPQKGAPVIPGTLPAPLRTNFFSDRWLLLEHVDGEMPDVRACAIVAKTIRDALLSGFQQIGLHDRIPEALSGHATDGSPSRRPHAAIIPLAFTGFPYADGRVLGFALIPPQQSALLEDTDFRAALRTLAPLDDQRGRRILTVTTRAGTASDRAFSLLLSPTFEAGRRSLDRSLYLGPARTFATVTPIVLDRHLKSRGTAREDEMRMQIIAACAHVGLPEPERVVVFKHSAIEGASSAYPSGRAPGWLRWHLPDFLASRQLTHAVIQFPMPVAGPVILGAGRFVGLGLCRPLDTWR